MLQHFGTRQFNANHFNAGHLQGVEIVNFQPAFLGGGFKARKKRKPYKDELKEIIAAAVDAALDESPALQAPVEQVVRIAQHKAIEKIDLSGIAVGVSRVVYHVEKLISAMLKKAAEDEEEEAMAILLLMES